MIVTYSHYAISVTTIKPRAMGARRRGGGVKTLALGGLDRRGYCGKSFSPNVRISRP